MFLPNSDIDLVVEERSLKPKKLLFKMAQILEEEPETEVIEIISHAKVPIIKCQDKKTRIQMDFVFNEFSGLVQIDQFSKSKESHPEFKYLYMLLKLFLKQRNLNNTYSGGVGIFN